MSNPVQIPVTFSVSLKPPDLIPTADALYRLEEKNPSFSRVWKVSPSGRVNSMVYVSVSNLVPDIPTKSALARIEHGYWLLSGYAL